MVELRRAMEALQSKLSKAEERLFGQDGRRDSDRKSCIASTTPTRHSANVDEQPQDVDHLFQRLLSAEEEMKREQELLVALDRKQKLIEAQEEKVSPLVIRKK